jgi:O-antigen/teichoic acid export membrane protein
LIVSWVFFALNLPFASMLYALEKPSVVAAASFLTLVLTFLSNLVLIPQLGAIGAAVSALISLVTVLATCVTAVLVLFRKEPPVRFQE